MNLSDRASPPAASHSVSGRRPVDLASYAARHLAHALGEAGHAAAAEEWRERLSVRVSSSAS
jgi:hypothetical protein